MSVSMRQTTSSHLQIISLGGDEGPEHIVLARDGKLYAAVASGNILRMNPDGTAQEVFVNTGGRVLGFDFDATGNLIAADSIKGLLSVSPDRKITVLTNAVEGDTSRLRPVHQLERFLGVRLRPRQVVERHFQNGRDLRLLRSP